MKKYKKLFVPPVNKKPHLVQELHCTLAVKCVTDCDECLYASQNIKEFTEWYNKKRR